MKELFDYKLIEIGNYLLTVGMVVSTILILIGTKIGIRMIHFVFLKRTQKFPEFEERHNSFFILLTYAIWVVALVLMLESLNFKITLLLAGSAALLVGLGLGLQQTFNDFISGIIILFEGSLKKTDIVEVDGLLGRVTDIKLRTSIIYTRDGINIIVPNHKLINENVINWSHHSHATRFKIEIGVAYESDELLVRDILLGCMQNNPSIITDDPENYPIFVRIINFGDSSIDFEILFWSNNIFSIENSKSEIRFEILKKFRENGIVIPFPQREITLKSTKNNGKS